MNIDIGILICTFLTVFLKFVLNINFDGFPNPTFFSSIFVWIIWHIYCILIASTRDNSNFPVFLSFSYVPQISSGDSSNNFFFLCISMILYISWNKLTLLLVVIFIFTNSKMVDSETILTFEDFFIISL